MKKIIKKLFTPFAVFAMAIGIGVSLSAPKEVSRTKAAPVLYNSFNFKDGGDSSNSNYASTNIATKVSYASDNPGGTSGTTNWEADYANLSMTSETRLGGKSASTVQTNDTTPWANIKTKFTFPVPIEQVEIIEVGTFGTASKVENVYLQSSLDSETWTTIGSTANKSGTVTFSDLTVPANSYLRLGVGLTASGTNSGLKFTGIKVYENENAVTKALTSISASGTPTKTSYYDGDSFDPNGLTITAAFDDGSSADVTSLATFSPDPLTVGTTSVTASYSYGNVTKTTVISGITVQVKVSTVVISEVYGGGGNSGSLYRNDFVELYNNTDINIDISGWTVHYASAAGSFNNKTTLPDNSIILPYSYYLVKWAAGSSTEVPELPTADVEGSVFAGAKEFKVALTNNDTAPNSPTDTNVVDYVGAGNATAYEGAVAPGPSNSESISRTKSGNIYVDTDNNSADFTVGAPTPMNSALSIAEKIMETDTEMQCVTKFPEMKALVVQLSEGQLEYFQSTGDETLMVNARARYLAWAAYLGDNDAYGNGTGSSARSTTTNSSSNNVAAIALIGVIGITTLVGYYFINKKRLTA
jgi:hypothetical protein